MNFSVIIHFLQTYDIPILCGVFASVWLVGIVNWCRNIYFSQNRKLNYCRRSVERYGRFTAVQKLPPAYRRQWRAYANSGALRPSLTFEFAPQKHTFVLWRVLVADALVCSCYLLLFVLDFSRREYLVFQPVFWLAVALVAIVDKILFVRKEKRAGRILGRFVVALNNSVKSKPTVRSVVQDIKEIKCSGEASSDKAAAALRSLGLNKDRTVAEQRQLNRALNGLLQTYARNAAKSKA